MKEQSNGIYSFAKVVSKNEDFINKYCIGLQLYSQQQRDSSLLTSLPAHFILSVCNEHTKRQQASLNQSRNREKRTISKKTTEDNIQQSNFTFKTQSINANSFSPFRQKKDMENLIQEFLTDYQDHSRVSSKLNKSSIINTTGKVSPKIVKYEAVSTKKQKSKKHLQINGIKETQIAIIAMPGQNIKEAPKTVNVNLNNKSENTNKSENGNKKESRVIKQQKTEAQTTQINYLKKYEAKKDKQKQIKVRLSSPQRNKNGDQSQTPRNKMPIKIEIQIPLQEDQLYEDQTYSIYEQQQQKKMVKQIISHVKGMISKINVNVKSTK